jgi:serine/threonine protein kinase
LSVTVTRCASEKPPAGGDDLGRVAGSFLDGPVFLPDQRVACASMSQKPMRWCARCRRRLYDQSAAFCPFDGSRLEAPADEPAGDPYLGTILQGQFHIEEEIGSGAMGTVYRAWQTGMERAVAIKLLRSDVRDDGEMRRRFLREGRAVARLNHPNIVSVYTVGQTGLGVPYLVMEYLCGETLDELLDREVRLAPARAVAIARQIASGLAEAHGAGIVHRDLKPGNVVLLQRRGSGEIVKLFDFGIAKLADGALLGRDASRLTRDGEIFGTPHYIAPEQAQGAALDGRADLYSLGVLLYRMLSGRLPFEGNAVAVLLAHIGREVPDLARVAPDIDPALARLVMGCLVKDPARRVATADHLIAALDEAAGARRVPSSPGVRARDARQASSPGASAATGGPRPASSPGTIAARGEPRPASSPGASAATTGPRPARVVEPVESASWGAAASSWTRSRGGEPGEPALALRPRRGRARAALTGLAIAIVCSGAGTGAATLLRRGQLGPLAAGDDAFAAEPALRRIDVAQSPSQPPGASEPARQAVMLSEDGYAVRALLPEPIRAGRPVELLFDVWDRGGAPLVAPAIPIELASAGSPVPARAGADRALAARPDPDLPGRYRLVASFPLAGEAAALIELADGGSIHVHFEVAPALDH